MFAHPIPIYLGCAGLIVGCLGLGGQALIGQRSVPATAAEPPLFARSVEEAALPAQRWPSQNLAVAHYGPTLELLTSPTPGRSPTDAEQQALPRDVSRDHQPMRDAALASPPSTVMQRVREEPVPREAVPREVVRELPNPQTRKSAKRTKKQRTKDVARRGEPSESRKGEARQRTTGEAADDNLGRSERRYRDRDDAEPRSRPDRRRHEPERTREVLREPEQRVVSGPNHGGGFNPFRLFGVFDAQ